MANTGAHPGVRSLLARFENNNTSNSNPNNTSPPSRGRSPVGSEHSDSRPLSKVRASFVAVNGATQSSPVAGLRSASSHSDSPIAPPSRVRSFNSDDLNAPLKSPLSSSPTSNGLGYEQPANEIKLGETVEPAFPQATPLVKVAESQAKEATLSHNPEPEPTRTAPTAPSSKKTKAVTKRPSTIQVDKITSANKPATKTTSSTALKSPAHPRTPTSPAKPNNARASRAARSPKPTTTRASSKPPTTKPSRTTLNTETKTVSRPVRSSMPAREVSKSTASSAARTGKPEPKPPTKPARLPASATTPTLSSVSKGGATSATASNLSRKPSTLKNATSGTHRTTTPTASSVRKQTSQPSLQRQPAHERPHSRVSNISSKAVDEGFLARMMRPTASSANKAHEKVDVKSPPRPSRTTRAPVRPVAHKTEVPKSRPVKERSTSKEPPEKAQSVPAEEEPHEKVVDFKEDAPQANTTESHAEAADKPVQPVVDSTIETTVKEVPAEKQSEDVPVVPSMESSVEAPVEPFARSKESVQATETPTVQTADTTSSSEEPLAPLVEKPEDQTAEPSDLSNTEETKEQTGVETPAAIAEEKSAETVTETDSKDDIDVDLENWSLN
ncbi:hypothetical protein BBP40_004511 [Aspergillus hancockii]|nr:hypothetical protein BBP40_004511 [Aspergillus hancockii]